MVLDMSNEPVAWFEQDPDMKSVWYQADKDAPNAIPLYTHPAKCFKCNDTEWVCENHPNQEAHKCIYCEGAGKPCECAYPAKTLTDEEIRHIQAQCHLKNVGYDNFIMRFARAILKKAQEK